MTEKDIPQGTLSDEEVRYYLNIPGEGEIWLRLGGALLVISGMVLFVILPSLLDLALAQSLSSDATLIRQSFGVFPPLSLGLVAIGVLMEVLFIVSNYSRDKYLKEVPKPCHRPSLPLGGVA